MDETKAKDRQLQRVEDARIVRRIVFIAVSLLVLIIFGGALGGYLYVQSALKPLNQDDNTPKEVTIPIGSSTSMIASTLEENGIIKNAKVFKYYIKFKNEAGFQAGDYKLAPSMEIQAIIDQLKTGKVIKEALFTITIPEGKQLEQMANIIGKKTAYSQEEFMKKVDDPAYLNKLIDLYPTILSKEILNKNIRHPLEGYLFPATYDYYEKKPSIEAIIEKMLAQTELMLSPYIQQIKEKNMSVHEVLTMASLIEEEATSNTDRKKISGVFYNRIKTGMPLQTDPTVLYALNKHKVKIYTKDLQVDSPYNTYQIPGLPVGPISNPGEISIQAALEPAATNDLYFYARPNGDVIFTATLQEHNRVKNKYKQEWDQYNNNR